METKGTAQKIDTSALVDLKEGREQEKIAFGRILYEALYNRILDPENTLTDAEEKDIEPIVQRVQNEGIHSVSTDGASLYRKYKRHEISKIRNNWFASSIGTIRAIGDEGLIERATKKKIDSYYEYLYYYTEQGKLKKMYDTLDVMVGEVVVERLLEELFPLLKGLEGQDRQTQLEKTLGVSAKADIESYIDNPATQIRYEGYRKPKQAFYDREKVSQLLDTLLIVEKGLYLPPELTRRVVILAKTLKIEIKTRKKSSPPLDSLDATVAQLLVERVIKATEDLARYSTEDQAALDESTDKTAKATRAIQVHILEELKERLETIFA